MMLQSTIETSSRFHIMKQSMHSQLHTRGKDGCSFAKYTLTTRSKYPRSSSLLVGVYARIIASPFSYTEEQRVCMRDQKPAADVSQQVIVSGI